MTADDPRPVHADFKLIERDKQAGGANVSAIGGLLRAAWALPKDTYVTQDIPVLLTLLCLREAEPAKHDLGSGDDMGSGDASPADG